MILNKNNKILFINQINNFNTCIDNINKQIGCMPLSPLSASYHFVKKILGLIFREIHPQSCQLS